MGGLQASGLALHLSETWRSKARSTGAISAAADVLSTRRCGFGVELGGRKRHCIRKGGIMINCGSWEFDACPAVVHRFWCCTWIGRHDWRHAHGHVPNGVHEAGYSLGMADQKRQISTSVILLGHGDMVVLEMG
jgi:hypothetical protein